MHNTETNLEKATKSLQWQEKIIKLNFVQWSRRAISYLPICQTSSNSSSCQGLEEQTLLFHEEFAEQDLKNSSLETQRQHRRESSTPSFMSRRSQGRNINRARLSFGQRPSQTLGPSRILQIKKGVIHRGRRPRWITPSKICRILHILRKPNSIIALLFIENISSFLRSFAITLLVFPLTKYNNLVPRFSRSTVQ